MLESLMLAQLEGILETLTSGWYIFLVLLGICIIIFVHELGHFLAARLMGIRVEAFAIGFGPKLISYRRRHTEYSIRVIPFGGYVKMLGQEDAALDQERVQATRQDPESFLAKSISQRMFVISGGVIMNVIFAAVAFIFVFMHGMKEEAPVVGEVIPGSPAARAGLQPGDVIKQINGGDILHFAEMQVAVMFSSPGHPVDVELERDGKILHVAVKPEWDKEQRRLMIGVAGARSLKIYQGGLEGPAGETLKTGDVIVKVDSVRPRVFADVESALINARGRPVELLVTRTVKEDGREEVKTLTVKRRAYLVLLPEPTATNEAQTGLEAGNASLLGFQPRCKFLSPPGYDPKKPNPQTAHPLDVVVRAANITNPTKGELVRYFLDRRGKEVELKVLRDGARMAVKVEVPGDRKVFEFFLSQLGVDDENPVIANTVSGSPAHALKIPRGARMVAAGDGAVHDWFDLIDALDAHAGKQLSIRFQAGDKEFTGTLRVPADKPWDRTITFAVDIVPYPWETIIKGKYPHQAVILGVRQTWYFIKLVYITLQRMFIDRSVDVKQLGGPIFIMHAGKNVAEAGFYRLLYFLALISANLAVVNFLPLPLFDGGYIILLGYEKIRGKPLSPQTSAIWQAVGFGLIILLFAVLTYNDIQRIVTDW